MEAVVLENRNIEMREVPLPEPMEGEALIKVLKAGICNTDLELVAGYMDFQGILGHEFVGKVADSPNRQWVGKRVAGEINIPCGNCEICLEGNHKHCPSRKVLGIQQKDGVFAEYVTLPLGNLIAIPPNLSDIEAVFIEPLAAALAVFDQVHIDRDNDVLVMGDGKLGLLIAQVVQTRTPNVCCVGHHPHKLALLQKRGIPVTRDIQEWNRKFDLVVEATGNPEGIAEALSSVRPKGRIIAKSTIHQSTSIDMSEIVVNEVHVIGSRCGSFEAALRFLEEESLRLEDMVDSDFPLKEARRAFERAENPEAIKVLLTP